MVPEPPPTMPPGHAGNEVSDNDYTTEEEDTTPYTYEFRYHHGNTDFQCELVRRKCKVTYCNRQISIGLPYCRPHTRTKMHLDLKPSTVPNAGSGVFAHMPGTIDRVVVFHQGDTVAQYFGQMLTEADIGRRYGKSRDATAPYAIENYNGNFDDAHQVKKRYIDSACERSLAAMINHSDTPNVQFEYENDLTANVKAQRDIYNGEELFADYSGGYQFQDTHMTVRKPNVTAPSRKRQRRI